MTLIELLVVLLVCLFLGFVAHLIFPAWHWWIGVVPFFAIVVLMVGYALLYHVVRHFRKKKNELSQ